jgi:general secretion pathway protein A
MYTSYFGLTEKPFSITPDPRFLYLSERHAEALAHLQYGVLEGGGFIQLTGEVGTGKTTVTRSLLGRLPDTVELAAILNPQVDLTGFLRTVCHEFSLPADTQDHKALLDALNRHLLDCHAAGRRAVLVIDEAQNLDRAVLEQIRLLTNLETETAKLLQIILIGQPELRETLARPDLRQLAQRITGRYHLDPLSAKETADYVRHRLDVAGATQDIFSPAALREVHRCAGGIPRLVNVICDRALLGAWSRMERRVEPALVRRAAREVRGPDIGPQRRPLPVRALAGGAIAVAATVAAAWLWAVPDFGVPPGAGRGGAALAGGGEPAPAPDTLPAARATGPQEAIPVPAAPAATAGAGAAGDAAAAPVIAAGAAAPPATSAGAPTLDALLRQHAADTTTDRAFDRLFARWDVGPVPEGEQPCAWAVTHGLRCEAQLGSWGLLGVMDRPAILSLVDGTGERHHVLAASLGDDHVELLIGETVHAVSLGDVAPHWMGEYLLLWRPHPDADDLMVPGSRGPGVRWLREALAQVAPAPPAPGLAAGAGDYYDDTLAQAVRDFQRRVRLSADGKAGLRTLIALNSALGVADTPRLAGVDAGAGRLTTAWRAGTERTGPAAVRGASRE